MDDLRVTIKLLRSSLGLGSHCDADFGLIDWGKVEAWALKQNVLPLVFDGYKLLLEEHISGSKFQVPSSKFQVPGFKRMPTEQMLRWYAMTQQAEKHYAKHLESIRGLSEFFGQHGIRTAVLKGYALSLGFPIPEHRPCGDIDIYQFGKDWLGWIC